MSLRTDIAEDLRAHGYLKSDALSILKAWISHPSIRLLVNYRLAKIMKGGDLFSRFIKRSLWLNTVHKTGCHISPHTTIEPGVIFPHATNIVIGNGAHISKAAKIFQNVTLGVKDDDENKSAHIGKNAIIYSGAVLVGDIVIGKNAVIGANAVVKSDVPENMMAVGIPAKIKPINNSDVIKSVS